MNKKEQISSGKLPKPLYRYLRDNHKCIGCGKCCHCSPIVLAGEDIRVMAFKLGMSVKDFKKEYTEVYPGNARLSHFKHENPCAFLDENNKCKIYDSRPAICRAYPLMKGTRIPHECETLNALVGTIINPDGSVNPEKLIPYTKDKKGY
jgi:Fe-S-cluster containining protein